MSPSKGQQIILQTELRIFTEDVLAELFTMVDEGDLDWDDLTPFTGRNHELHGLTESAINGDYYACAKLAAHALIRNKLALEMTMKHPKPWTHNHEDGWIYDANGTRFFERQGAEGRR